LSLPHTLKRSGLIQHLILVLLLTLTGPIARATHISGGEMTYTYLGNNQYRVDLTIFRDCSPNNTLGTGFDDIAYVGAFRPNGLFVFSFEMDLIGATTDFIPVNLENPCFVLPPDVCIQRAVYSEVVTFDPSADGYILAYQRCCSNASVANLDFPNGTGMTLTSTIPGTATATWGNSSPVFNNLPSVAMCLNAEYFFDQGAVDPDGDDLEYFFCDPLQGADQANPAPAIPSNPPFLPVVFSNGFSSSYPIPSAPAFSINPETGYITGTPNQLGMYVVCLCVQESRNGVVLNTTRRNFQFRVTACDPNIVAGIIPQSTFCFGTEFQFTNNSINATTFSWDFGVPFIESDTSNVANPVFAFPGAGNYTVSLIANPGWPCADTASAVFDVFDPISPTIELEEYLCMDDTDNHRFLPGGNYTPAATFLWDFGPGSFPSQSTEENPPLVQLNPENAVNTVALTIADQGCESTVELDVVNPPDPVASIVPQNAFCEGFEYQFSQNSQNAASYRWDFGLSTSAGGTSQSPNPLFAFPGPGTYQVELLVTAPNTCPDSMSLPFFIAPLLVPFFNESPSQCFNGHSFDFSATGFNNPNAAITWTFEGPASDIVSSGPQAQNITWAEPGVYTVQLNIQENNCNRTYEDEIWVAMNPLVDFTVEDPIGCPGDVISFFATVEADTPLAFEWDFGNGFGASTLNANHVYQSPGIYDVSLSVTATSGCIGTVTRSQTGLVTIHPLPIPGFSAQPAQMDILNPICTVTSETDSSYSCYYVMSDGSTSNDCSFVHEWTEAGRQEIRQVVTNVFGCVASAVRNVSVSGLLFYLPNAFTPNDDGVNDAWKAEHTGITRFKISLWNRWGVKIWETNDPDFTWMGQQGDGQYFVPDGVYFWQCELEDLVSLPHTFAGTVSISR
jgi:gliding motility-associated-like protein